MKLQRILDNKVGIFSDTHLGLGQDSRVWQEAHVEFAGWAADFYRSQDIAQILIPGDFFHNRNEIGLTTLNTANRFLEHFQDFQLFISTGNHCCFYKNSSEINSLSILKGRPNITIIDDDVTLFRTKSGKFISMVPWAFPVENIPKTDVCVGHFEIISFSMNADKVCDHGEESKNMLDKAPLVISGHFHKRSSRSYSKGEIVYIGSPYQQNFGDHGNIHGISILDCAGEKPVTIFKENKLSPVHHKISLKNLAEGKYGKDLASLIKDNMICLMIDREIRADKLSLLTSKLQELGPKFFRIDYQNCSANLSPGESDNQYNAVDIPKSIQDFVSVLETEHKADTTSYLLELYNKLAV